ncbi:MAG: LamG-like jellyroll fold domain-containing protein [Tepidisphaeraceae bacterium]
MNTDIASDGFIQTSRGKAFCTAWNALDIPWHERFDQPSFTVEIWAIPKLAKEWLITCVYPRGSAHAESGWGLVVGSQGELAAMIAGKQTRWVWNQPPIPIIDGQWHHLAMTFDGQELVLYVDGKRSAQDETLADLPMDMPREPGLQIGSETTIDCAALVQEVRLSRGLRVPPATEDRMRPDEQTLALWRLDDDGVPDVTGRCPSGVIKTFARESLDELERREYRAGPAPLDLPVQIVEPRIGDAVHVQGPSVLSLDGQWQMAEAGEEASRLGEPWLEAIAARVPGSVHAALEAAGKIPDPKFGLNDAIARENSFKTWWFRKSFPRPAGSGHRLVFDGVAIHCTVWLNGVKLGEHEGMFGGPAFDVSSLLREENDLIVKLDPAPQGPPWFAPTANTGWKKTVVFNNVYGWHYCHIPALGIWRSVRVEAAPAVKLRNPFVVTHDALAGDISLRIDVEGPRSGWRGSLLATIGPENFEGIPVHFSLPVSAEGARRAVHLRLRLPDARAWWPHGLGTPNLYRLKLSLRPERGQGDFCSTTFGLRTLAMAPFPGGRRRSLYNWTFVINGRPTFLKGTGWCTMDSSMDFRPQRYERFLKLAREQNCQMVRAWGSGMPETDEFYDCCDRLGITVLQEWPTAWNSHEAQPYDALEETVRLNTLRLRNHPSLLMWGGGNESSNPSGKTIDMMGRYAIELDGTRPFHRGEPWGGSDHNYACWWGKAHLDHNLKMTSRFFGEFGIASMPVHESVQRYLPIDQRAVWPPDENGVFAHHTPVFNTMQDMDRLRQYAGYFSAGGSMQRFIVASQIAQAVAVRHTLERARTRWPQCTGALMYKLNDNYPGASWSTADWYGAAKIGHWFVQDAFAPLHACLLFDSVNNQAKALQLPVFLLDDADALADTKWRVMVRAYDGQLRLIQDRHFDGSGSIQGLRHLGDFSLTERQTDTAPLFIVAEVHRGGQPADRTFYFVNYEARKDALFQVPTTTLSLKVGSDEAVIRNTGQRPAVGAAVLRPGHLASFSAGDNYFWLDPGESNAIRVSDTDGLAVDAWNLDGRTW